MRILVLSLFTPLFISLSFATTFIPLPIKKQVKESGKVVEGSVISLESKLHNGVIISSVRLLVDKWIGLELNQTYLNVHFPGGRVENQVYKVEGTPEFELGEDVVLMLVEQDGKFWVNNLGLGKYSIKMLGERKVLVNQIFPNHPGVGQISVDKFHTLTEWVTKKKFKERYKDKYEINNERDLHSKIIQRRRGRSIASEEFASGQNEKDSVPAIWLVIVLGLMVAIVRFFRRKST